MSAQRRVLITGTSRGIGRALAEHCLRNGDLVIGCSRGSEAIEHTSYRHVRADLADPVMARDVFHVIRQELGYLDALINNVGTAKMLPLALTPDETAQRILDVNVMTTYRMIQGAIRFLRKSKGGRIVNLTSVAVPLRLEGESLYAASKAAVEVLTRTVAKEIGPWSITCNAIGPSPIRTDLLRGVPEDRLQALVDRQSVRRWAEASDVSNVVDFFLRPESSMITGQVIYLGGLG
jgi:3-oxoacyl-[acyl-carrier protein] reductase